MSNTIISLTMKDWTVETRRPSIGFSGENEVVTLVISTEDDLSEFNEFYLDVGWQSYETGWKTNKNIIDLAGVGPLSVNLTANMLGPDGVKRMQLRATDGTRVKKSNVFEVLVKKSVNAADYYDESKSLAETIGDLDDLQTTAKANLVAAINEVNSKATTNTTAIGTLANLTTTEKSNLVGAINEVNEDVSDVKEELENISGISDDVKVALLQIASKVAYIDEDGQDYYDALESALYPPADLVSISAVYTQSGAVYDTDTLDSLKADLVVTALYSDQTTQTVTSYTLSGTLTVGTSTITVSYGGKTTTFNVTVTEPTVLTGYTEVGSPTISDNILTVGDGKFIKTNIPFAPSSDPWEVVIKYRKTAAFGGYTDIIGTVDSSNASSRGFLFEINNGTGTKGAMFASSNGSAWDIMSTENVEPLPEPTSWVWISMAFTGTAYVLKTSTDGETWTTQKTKESSTPIYDDGYYVGFGLKRNGYIRGDVDLTGCRIYKNGILWWKAVA